MNERIKQLLLQAGFTNAYTDPKEGFELVFVDEEHTTESVTKFAELIVRECVKVMYDNAIERKVPPDINQTPTHYAVAVLEHFGVEE
jgi:hypothetical protein